MSLFGGGILSQAAWINPKVIIASVISPLPPSVNCPFLLLDGSDFLQLNLDPLNQLMLGCGDNNLLQLNGSDFFQLNGNQMKLL